MLSPSECGRRRRYSRISGLRSQRRAPARDRLIHRLRWSPCWPGRAGSSHTSILRSSSPLLLPLRVLAAIIDAFAGLIVLALRRETSGADVVGRESSPMWGPVRSVEIPIPIGVSIPLAPVDLHPYVLARRALLLAPALLATNLGRVDLGSIVRVAEVAAQDSSCAPRACVFADSHLAPLCSGYLPKHEEPPGKRSSSHFTTANPHNRQARSEFPRD